MTVKFRLPFWGVIVLGLATALPARAATAPDYAVVVSHSTRADPAWGQVVDALRAAHQAEVLVYDRSVAETLPRLRELAPAFACFVATPAEASRPFVAQVHQLTRKFNDDPYPDCLWGILTGQDAANALRIARHGEALVIRRVVGGTEVALEAFPEGVWFSELQAGLRVDKAPGGQATTNQVPSDTTEAVARALNDGHADLFVTSGHATERDWQMGYRYRNGQFRCEGGVLYGLDTQGHKYPVHSPNPKVYLPVGNCLMGHIEGTNAMALAFMNSGGVNQMIGYTVTTWYGYAGWGCLDYFVEQPGRYTLASAFIANQAGLVHRLLTYFPSVATADLDADAQFPGEIQVTEAARAAGLTAQDARGLLHDRDTLAFYGDPAWEARLAPGKLAWDQQLTCTNGTWTFAVTPNRGEHSYEPTNLNGSQRGGRPFVQFLPQRLQHIEILAGANLKPVITDNFILLPRSTASNPEYRVVFRGETRR